MGGISAIVARSGGAAWSASQAAARLLRLAPCTMVGAVRLAFVVQRYGESVVGGSESYCRSLAERLVIRPEVAELTVLTTTATDHRSWADALPAGPDRVGRVAVERYRPWLRRNALLHGAFGRASYGGRAPAAIEQAWLAAQGPVVPGLTRRIRELRASRRVDAFVFFTYLFATTVHGLAAAGPRSVLVPTAHDEPALRVRLFRRVFAEPRALCFLTDEERALVEERFPLPPLAGPDGVAPGQQLRTVLGVGIDAPGPAGSLPEGVGAAPYLLYLGRVTEAKGVPTLLEGYRRLRAEWPGGASVAPELVVAGAGTVAGLGGAGVRVLGPVSEAHKAALLERAALLVAPSRYESLSLVLLEAWARGRPVLVDAACAVTRGHVERSGGGAAYRDAPGLAAEARAMLLDATLAADRGASGRRYVEARYRWPVVERQLLDLLEAVARSPG